MPLESEKAWAIQDSDIEMTFTKDTGPGGQHRNKTESCVVLVHRPTGLTAKASARCQHANRRMARQILEVRVAERLRDAEKVARDQLRKAQVGSGERGDKVRTYCVQHGLVQDHRTGRKAPLKQVLSGRLDLLA